MYAAPLVHLVKRGQDAEPHVSAQFLGRAAESCRLTEEYALIGDAGMLHLGNRNFLLGLGSPIASCRPLSVIAAIGWSTAGQAQSQTYGGNAHNPRQEA